MLSYNFAVRFVNLCFFVRKMDKYHETFHMVFALLTHVVFLFVQCIWKMIKMVPEIINDLAVDKILLETHLFLRNFPTSTWKNRSSDLPLRTIKTVIHTLAMLKGAKVKNE